MGRKRARSTSSSSSSSSTDSSDRKRKKSKKIKKVKLTKHEKLVEKLFEMKRERKGAAPNGVILTKDDYFMKQSEFSVWLGLKKKKLDDFKSTESATEAFCKFALAWNTGKLPSALYTGVAATGIDSRCRTSYKWGFAKNFDRETKMELDIARDSTDTNTSKSWTDVLKKDDKRKGGKGGKGDSCSACRGPWPCRNMDCSKGRSDGGRDTNSNTCSACNGPWPCRNGNCPRGRPFKTTGSRGDSRRSTEATDVSTVNREPERYSTTEAAKFDSESSMRRAIGQERMSLLED